jgi:hypothetical protein
MVLHANYLAFLREQRPLRSNPEYPATHRQPV